MIKGIGIDTVSVKRIRAILERHSEGGLERLFSADELRAASKRADRAEYLAARFAVKEAVYKAVAHLTARRDFDLRIVSSLNDSDGCPYVVMTDALRSVLEEAGVAQLHLSVTTEDGLATAFIIAE